MSAGEDLFQLHCQAYRLEPTREFRFDPSRKWRADFCFMREMILIEIEGGTWQQGRHQRPAGYTSDCEKYNAAVLAGYRILRFTTAMVESGLAIDTVRKALGSL